MQQSSNPFEMDYCVTYYVVLTDGVNKQNHAFPLCTIQVFIIKGKVLLLLYKRLIVNEIFCHVFSW